MIWTFYLWFQGSWLNGCWISENGNQPIKCQVVDDLLTCTWPNQSIETYQIEPEYLKGTTNQQILGYPSEDCQMISWNTGNRWVKEGNCFEVLGYSYVNEILNQKSNISNFVSEYNFQVPITIWYLNFKTSLEWKSAGMQDQRQKSFWVRINGI